jgi:hypothetical protein
MANDILQRIDLRLLHGAPDGDAPIFVRCTNPDHRDSGRPNMAVYRRNVNCFRCGFHEGAFDYIRRTQNTADMGEVLAIAERICTDKVIAPPKVAPIDAGVVDVFESFLHHEQNARHLAWIQSRYGLLKETIVAARIGMFDRAYTIPVYDLYGKLVNIRYRILPEFEKPDEQRYWGTKGHNHFSWFFPPSFRADDGVFSWLSILQTKYENRNTICLTEGEWDALALWQEGIPAITATNGADSWRKIIEEVDAFQGLSVLVMYDQDEAGNEKGAELTHAFTQAGIPAHRVTWPIELGKDAADLVARGYSKEDFRQIVIASKSA